MKPDLSEAQRLHDQFFQIVKLKDWSKRPEGLKWNQECAKEIEPEATGYGFPLAANGRCSVDIDRADVAAAGMAALGFNLDDIMRAGVRTLSTRPGSGGRSMFTAVDGLAWLKFSGRQMGTVLEFRAASPNLQDCVPGLVYRDETGAEYTQTYANGKTFADDVPLPEGLRDWWLKCSTDVEFLRDQQRLFFEAIGDEGHLAISGGGESLAFDPGIDGLRSHFNRRTPVVRLLAQYGYWQDEVTKRYAPKTATGEPGVRQIPGKDGLWRSDHASDPLHGTFDAWSAWVVLRWGGDVAAAVKDWKGQHPEAGGAVAEIDSFPVIVGAGGGSGGIGEVIEYRRVGGKGRTAHLIVSNVEQLQTCLLSDSRFPWRIGFDEFLQERVIVDASGKVERLLDHHITMMRVWFDAQGWEEVGREKMRDVVDLVARQRSMNIAQRWLTGLEWDGLDRYEEALIRMGVAEDKWEYGSAVMEYLWTGHAGRVISPGEQCDSIVILISEPQGLGKTQLIKTLAPEIAGFPTYRDIHLDQLLSEDKSARAMRGCLVANMDEMRAFGKREAAEAKSALSRCKESYVPKYMEARTEFGRTCMIYATNNEMDFLDDDTGNRRYYPIVVGGNGLIDLAWFRENRDQLWAQGAAGYRQGGVAWQRAAAEGVSHVSEHEVVDSIHEEIQKYLNTCLTEFVCVSDIMSEGLKIPVHLQTRATQMRVGKALKYLGWTRNRRMIDGIRRYEYSKN